MCKLENPRLFSGGYADVAAAIFKDPPTDFSAWDIELATAVILTYTTYAAERVKKGSPAIRALAEEAIAAKKK